LESCAIA